LKKLEKKKEATKGEEEKEDYSTTSNDPFAE